MLMKKKLIMFVLALCIMVLFSIMENSNQAVVYADADECGELSVCFVPADPASIESVTVTVDDWNGFRESDGDHGDYILGTCLENNITVPPESDPGLEVKEWKESVSNN